MVLYEIATGLLPFDDVDRMSVFELSEHVIAGGRPEVPADAPGGYRSLMVSCWSGDPAARPTFSEVVSLLDTESEVRFGIVKRSGKHRRSAAKLEQPKSLQSTNI